MSTILRNWWQNRLNSKRSQFIVKSITPAEGVFYFFYKTWCRVLASVRIFEYFRSRIFESLFFRRIAALAISRVLEWMLHRRVRRHRPPSLSSLCRLCALGTGPPRGRSSTCRPDHVQIDKVVDTKCRVDPNKCFSSAVALHQDIASRCWFNTVACVLGNTG